MPYLSALRPQHQPLEARGRACRRGGLPTAFLGVRASPAPQTSSCASHPPQLFLGTSAVLSGPEGSVHTARFLYFPLLPRALGDESIAAPLGVSPSGLTPEGGSQPLPPRRTQGGGPGPGNPRLPSSNTSLILLTQHCVLAPSICHKSKIISLKS